MDFEQDFAYFEEDYAGFEEDYLGNERRTTDSPEHICVMVDLNNWIPGLQSPNNSGRRIDC